ncbi:ATP-binding cassette domain-containing protein [Microbacterium dauci]|uniref:ATP-binding cassette domain-containing protein n=1 Tax=Microbacterium dauci TaxID=3048008 RepID=A0ABT6ZDD6_9MICO|nr:ATP-binding cassette domain-containing protein [Microbacterium sp. LX3-4]MDJ1114158.1 ATP-binding cassette domain-containing protein [Microbacterium sp. LX3-4]
MNTPLLEVQDLAVTYPVKGWRRPDFRALSDISLTVERGETVGLVGESGSGKTTLGRAVLGLAPVASGRIVFEGRDISRLHARERRGLSSDIQVVFQDPYSSLNPAMTIADILAEPLSISGLSRTDALQRVRELLDQVGLPQDSSRRLPREFSGGQRQRIAIARALALRPKLIVCDEVVSALDLTTRSRVLDLLIDLQEQTGIAYLFIAHDLSVVRHISHRVVVMRRGRIVESGDAATITTDPAEPYTQRLLLAAPVPDPARQAARRAHLESLPPITDVVTLDK